MFSRCLESREANVSHQAQLRESSVELAYSRITTLRVVARSRLTRHQTHCLYSHVLVVNCGLPVRTSFLCTPTNCSACRIDNRLGRRNQGSIALSYQLPQRELLPTLHKPTRTSSVRCCQQQCPTNHFRPFHIQLDHSGLGNRT